MTGLLDKIFEREPVAAAFRKRSKMARVLPGSKGKILLSQYNHPLSVYASSFLADAFAAQGIDPASFHFSRTVRSVDAAFDAFGAPMEIDNARVRRYEKFAKEWARREMGALQDKDALLKLKLEGVPIGLLIYDSYLRYYASPTVDIRDPRLVNCAVEAARVLYCCADYFDRNDVRAVFPDHMVYNRSGVLAQLAWELDIPVYFFRYLQPFYIFKLPPKQRGTGALEVAYQHPFDHYPELFAALGRTQQDAAREKARRDLENHLSGRNTGLIFGNHSAYAEGNGARVLSEDSKPRVLVMLHDFCDAPHVFGNLLFPDFHAWIHHLLGRAQDTDFQWYVKPHPNLQSYGRNEMALANNRVVEELKQAYPKVRFLDPAVSNRQIMAEGVASMFTVYGSAGHEFAYRGIPVVNAGPNRHMRYGFNLHPRTLDEYDSCIARADRLDIQPRREEIEEFYYMAYSYLNDEFGAPFEIVPSDLTEFFRQGTGGNSLESVCHMLARESADLRRNFCEYVVRQTNKIAA